MSTKKWQIGKRCVLTDMIVYMSSNRDEHTPVYTVQEVGKDIVLLVDKERVFSLPKKLLTVLR